MKFLNADLRCMLNGDSNEGFDIIDDGFWIDEGKYACKDVVFEFDNKLYTVSDSRSGSYFSFYNYESDDWDSEEYQECSEVVRKKVVKVVYELK